MSPKLIRDFRLFNIHDDTSAPVVEVKAIHDEMGYRRVRKALAEQYDTSARDPDIQVTNADISGGRRLTLTHKVRNGVLLEKEATDRTLVHVAHLWGYRVKLLEVDPDTGKTLKEHETLPLP
jgi:spore cortex formation protein SpoVR/YcgB (stage V sporulation)